MGGAASARRLTGCWLGCVVGAAPRWCCAGRRGSLRRARRGHPPLVHAGGPIHRRAQQGMPKPHPRTDIQQSGVDRLLQRADIQVRHVGRAPAAPGTAQVLGFVGRRLLAEPVGLVFAARTTTESDDPLAGLPDLRLSRLGITGTGRGGFRRRVRDARQRQRSAPYRGPVFDAAARLAGHATVAAGGRRRSGRGYVQAVFATNPPLPLAEDPADILWRLVLGRSPIRLRRVYGPPRARNR